MRVLHVIKGLGPGGAERLLLSLAGARASDVDLEVAYLLPWKARLVPELTGAGVRVHLLAGRAGMSDLRWLGRLARLVRRTRPDVVHLHSPAVSAVARPVLRALSPRTVLVSSEHNLWPSFDPVTRLANALTLPLSHACLAVSDEVRTSIWSWYRRRVDVVVQGTPFEQLRARRAERDESRARLAMADDDLLVVTVANFREKKDYPMLLAVAAACADEPRLKFVSIGQGPLEREMHELHGQLRLDGRFRFLGFHPDPPAVVAGADVFALTSRHEGLPISLLEAMALGVPPVVTAVGGIPEVVNDGLNGLLVLAGDVEAFAGALRRLARDPVLRRALGEAAAERAAAFDIVRTQRQLESIYRALIAGR